MAGPVRTLTRVFESDGPAVGNREVHATLCQYFDEHPGFQRVASNYGTSGQGFLSSRYFSGSSGENAWAVYRAMSASIRYDCSVVWSYNENYTVNTWLAPTTYGVGVAIAWHSSSASWNGTTANTGSDYFLTASKPWKTGSTVFPRINGTGGTYATNKNGLLKIIDGGIASQLWQMTIIGDNDTTYGFLQSADAAIIGDARYFFVFGLYSPYTASYTLPLFMLSAYTMAPKYTTGDTTLSEIGSNQNGGISYTTTSDVRSFQVNYLTNVSRRAPRAAPEIYSLDEANHRAYIYPIALYSYETSHYHQLGVIPNLFACAGNAFGNIQDVSRSYVTLKIENTTGNNCSFVLPFTGSTDFFLRGTFE